ncbi:MAG: hypothetical protein WBA77_11795 [Microcoleaceae cyanobacterium]
MNSSNLAIFPPQIAPQNFNCYDGLPLKPEALWKIDQGIFRTTTWTEDGKIISLGYWEPGDVIGQPLWPRSLSNRMFYIGDG